MRKFAGVYDRSLVRVSAPSGETQAFRLHAGETPALPAPVTKDLSYTQFAEKRCR